MLNFEHNFSIKDVEKPSQRPIVKNALAKNAFLGYFGGGVLKLDLKIS